MKVDGPHADEDKAILRQIQEGFQAGPHIEGTRTLGLSMSIDIPADAKIYVASTAIDSERNLRIDGVILDGHPKVGKRYLLIEVAE